MPTTQSPGVYFEVQRRAPDVEPLRTDIAGFVGPTERGPVGRSTRVEGWKQYVESFGGETEAFDTSFALRGYFDNGGEVAYVVRTLDAPYAPAGASWTVGELDPVTEAWLPSGPAAGGFTSARYAIEAESPGAWGNGLRVTFLYMLRGRDGRPELQLKVALGSGEVEHLTGIAPGRLEDEIARRSRYVRVTAVPGFTPAPAAHVGPAGATWEAIALTGGAEQDAAFGTYLAHAALLLREPEVALLALPDMYRLPGAEPYQLLARVAAQADATLDRQVIAALPATTTDVVESRAWSEARRAELSALSARSVAVYHPWLDVENPLGGVLEPLRRVSPVGHVAGVISRLDRERGAHHTPANAPLHDAVDVGQRYDAADQGDLVESGLNPLRCRASRGLQVWGGRTLADRRDNPEGLFLAHRRLIHRLVRAIRRVTEPLVFETNGPRLRLVLVRAVTTVLLQAYRAGALKGARAEQAFRVVCDDTNNPPAEQEMGRLHCDVRLAPAAPMEFITLRIAIAREGQLELIEA